MPESSNDYRICSRFEVCKILILPEESHVEAINRVLTDVSALGINERKTGQRVVLPVRVGNVKVIGKQITQTFI